MNREKWLASCAATTPRRRNSSSGIRASNLPRTIPISRLAGRTPSSGLGMRLRSGRTGRTPGSGLGMRLRFRRRSTDGGVPIGGNRALDRTPEEDTISDRGPGTTTPGKVLLLSRPHRPEDAHQTARGLVVRGVPEDEAVGPALIVNHRCQGPAWVIAT